MRFFILFIFSLATLFALEAQELSPKAMVAMEGNGLAIDIHQYSGTPIVRTNVNYTAIDPVSHEVIWTKKRSDKGIAMAILSDDKSADFEELYDTPYVFVSGSILDASTGKVVIDGELDTLRALSTYYIVPEADLIVIEMVGKQKIHLYGINPFENAQKWGVVLREVSGLSQTLAANGEGGIEVTPVPPLVTAGGDLLYNNGKYLAAVDLKTGSLRWNEKLDPAYIFLNDDATRLLVAERRSALGAVMSTSLSAKPSFGKKLHLLDATTGKSLWSKGESKMDGNIKFIMPYEDGFAVVHDAGFNIFNYEPGKEAVGRWKKDYAESGINNVIPEENGLMVYFKNKRMLIDPVNGEEKWKKAEKLEREEPDFAMGRKSKTLEVGGASIYAQGENLYVKAGKGITSSYRYESYAIDEAANRLVLTRIDSPGGAYIGPIQYSVVAIDLATGKSSEGTFSLRKGVGAIDVVSNDRYFLYNDRTFVLLEIKEGKWTEIKSKFYSDPNATERFFKGLAMQSALGAAQVNNSLGGAKAVITNDEAAYESYARRMNTLDDAQRGASNINERKVIGRVEQNFGYFFSRDDEGQLNLFKVDKKTGAEVKKYPFEDEKPIYEIDNSFGQLYYVVDDWFKIFKL